MNRAQRRAAEAQERQHGAAALRQWQERAAKFREDNPKAPVRDFELMDGREQRRKFPATFHVPSDADLADVGPGDAVKVAAFYRNPGEAERAHEKFWVTVLARDGDKWRGTVANHLVARCFHGLDHGDELEFESRHVLNVEEGSG